MSGSGTYGIKGLPRPDDAVTRTHKPDGKNEGIPYVEGLPVRHEISALANSKDPDHRRQWTLFVLALEKFKLKPVEDKLSYFQVAGIVSFGKRKDHHCTILISPQSTATQRLLGTELQIHGRTPRLLGRETNHMEGTATTTA